MKKLSARNQLKGTIVEVKKGATTSHVRIDIGNGIVITSSITNEAVADLNLKTGDEAWAVIKASDVMIGKDVDGARLSARNVLAGELANILEGAVNNEAQIKLPGGTIVVASITKAGVNAFHGDLFEFLRNTNLDARNYFSPTRGSFDQNQFGGTAGGPIR